MRSQKRQRLRQRLRGGERRPKQPGNRSRPGRARWMTIRKRQRRQPRPSEGKRQLPLPDSLRLPHRTAVQVGRRLPRQRDVSLRSMRLLPARRRSKRQQPGPHRHLCRRPTGRALRPSGPVAVALRCPSLRFPNRLLRCSWFLAGVVGESSIQTAWRSTRRRARRPTGSSARCSTPTSNA